jgi:ABC-type uncharacterized transport system substrate-binding protein
MAVDLSGKRLALLKEAVPNLSRVALLVDPGDGNTPRIIPSHMNAAKALGISLRTLSYGPDFLNYFRRAAGYTDKILKGAKPAELPVEQPAHFKMVINAKAAGALGLNIPASLLLAADEVIE